MFCEGFIRKAAGMGRGMKIDDPDSYEKVNAFCDLLVVGGGASGLSAALTAARAGADVILVEQDFELGGSLLSQPVGSESDRWLEKLQSEHCEVILLSRIEGLTMKEIAEKTGRPLSTVKYQLACGLAELKKHFGDTESLHLPDRQLEAEGDDNDE